MKNVFFYLLISLVTSCNVEYKNTSDEHITEIENQLKQIEKKEGYSGTVLIAQNDNILFERAFGFANLAHNVPNKTNTKFATASMGKMFTAVAIMQLKEQGKLNLDTKVGAILPNYPNVVVRDSVTVAHLLTHTSGLTDFFNDKFEHRAKHTVRTLADYFDFFKDEPLLFSPGHQFSYSNSGYIVLGMLIEKLTEQTYYDYVKQNIFIPAGMDNTDYYETDASIENIAEGYIKKDNNGIWKKNTYMKGARGSSAGGAYATTHDLFNFAKALKSNTFISKESLELMNSQRDGITYGYGFTINTFNNIEVYGHNGGAHGVSAELDIYKNSDIVVVTLSNKGPLDGWVDVRSMIRKTFAGTTKETDKYLGTKALIEIYKTDGYEAAFTKMKVLENNISDRYLMDAANKYRDAKQFNKAIDLLKLLTTAIPDSWYNFSILADTYLDAGNEELAIENYNKSLKLDPKNEWAIEKLETLKKK